jgi:recombination protein RecT
MNAKSTEVAAVKEQPLSGELQILRPEIEKVLPPHVTADKFMRVVLTAISQSPDLYNADRRSLLTSAVKAAQDGLLPDGREAAFVIFNTKEKRDGRDVWVKKVQYMPMVFGILKKVRNSGELLSITSNVVYDQDTFRYWIDDVGEHITHEPNVLIEDRGKLIAVYAIAKTKDTGVYTEVMSRSQIEQVREISKAKDSGPWGSWYDEMARKTVIRRLSKRLPMSTDLETVIKRDDEFYDLSKARANARSGVAAAKELLGLDPPKPQEPSEPDEDNDIPHYDTESAIKALREAEEEKTLKDAWKSILEDYKATNRELPVDIEAVYNECCETFEP